MTNKYGTVDLSVNFECDDETIDFIRKFLCINKVGLVCKKNNISNRDNVILKVKKTSL